MSAPITPEVKQQVARWIEEGLTLSQIQDRLATEFGVRLKYMEARLLVDDLKLMPKEKERPVEPKAATEVPDANADSGDDSDLAGATGAGGGVKVSVDTLARPGAIVSGSVTFSDGKSAKWYLDQTGRLGLAGDPGYRPPTADLQEFQSKLDRELQKLGF
jgi:hypothetical protein